MSLAAYLGYNKTDFPPVPLDRAGRAHRFLLPHLPVWQKEKKISSRCREGLCMQVTLYATARWKWRWLGCSSLVANLLLCGVLPSTSALSKCHEVTLCHVWWCPCVLLACFIAGLPYCQGVLLAEQKMGGNYTYSSHKVLAKSSPIGLSLLAKHPQRMHQTFMPQRIILRWWGYAK